MKRCGEKRLFICGFFYQVTCICRPSQARVVPSIARPGTGTSNSIVIIPSKVAITYLESKQGCWNSNDAIPSYSPDLSPADCGSFQSSKMTSVRSPLGVPGQNEVRQFLARLSEWRPRRPLKIAERNDTFYSSFNSNNSIFSALQDVPN